MAGRFHINPTTQKVGVCDPKKTQRCQFGAGAAHFATKELADAALERQLDGEYGQDTATQQRAPQRRKSSVRFVPVDDSESVDDVRPAQEPQSAAVSASPSTELSRKLETGRSKSVIHFANGTQVQQVSYTPDFVEREVAAAEAVHFYAQAKLDPRRDPAEVAHLLQVAQERIKGTQDEDYTKSTLSVRADDGFLRIMSSTHSARANDYKNGYPSGTTEMLETIDAKGLSYAGTNDVSEIRVLAAHELRTEGLVNSIRTARSPKLLEGYSNSYESSIRVDESLDPISGRVNPQALEAYRERQAEKLREAQREGLRSLRREFKVPFFASRATKEDYRLKLAAIDRLEAKY